MNKVIASEMNLLLRSNSSPPASPTESEIGLLIKTFQAFFNLDHLSHEDLKRYVRDSSFRYVLTILMSPKLNTKEYAVHAKLIGLMTKEGALNRIPPQGVDAKFWEALCEKSKRYCPIEQNTLFTFSSPPHALGVIPDLPETKGPPIMAHTDRPEIKTVLEFLDKPSLDALDSFLIAAKSIGFLGDHYSVSSFETCEKASGISCPAWKDMISKWGAIYTHIVAENSKQETPPSLLEHLEQFFAGYHFDSILDRNGIGQDIGDDLRILIYALETIRKFEPQLGQPFILNLETYCGTPKSSAYLHAIEISNGTNHASIPSATHSGDNQDRIVVGALTIPKGSFTVVCDGVSNCGRDREGKPITGRSAAINISVNLQGFLAKYTFPPDFNPTDKSHLTKLQVDFNHFLKKKMSFYLQHPRSATTLEVALEIPFGEHTYLVTLTCGDSQTMVLDPAGTFHMMNICQYYSGFIGNEIINLDEATDFLKHPIDLVRNMTNPGGSITLTPEWTGSVRQYNFYNHTLDNQSCGVSVKQLNPGSTYFVGSDGFFDMTTVSISEDIDFNDLPRLQAITKLILALNLPDPQTAELLSAIAVLVSGKLDDITLLVKTVGV